jgi:subtilisin family serine protease
MKRTLLASLLACLPFISFGQNYSIQLESGIFVPTVKTLGQVNRTTEEIVNGNYYRYIQFKAIPTEEQKATMVAKGIKLYNYIPNNTFMASIPASLDLTTIDDGNIRTVFTLNKTQKVSADLAKKKIPEWAIRGNGKMEVTMLQHPDIPAAQVRSLLTAEGADVLHSLEQLHAHRVIISIADLGRFASLPYIYFIEAAEPEPTPDNLVGRTDHRSNTLATDYATGLKYDGSGVAIALNDDGMIGPHTDYQGRIIGQFTTSNTATNDHGDHCAGTIFGAGNKDPKARGMAFGATLGVYRVSSAYPSGYQAFDSIYNHYVSKTIRITSTSYSDGSNAGYTNRARLMDQQINSMPELMHVFSSGNAGSDSTSYGVKGWGNVTGGHKQAKNVIAVANLTYQDVLAASSSRGPAKDGRIKPDISAVGTSVYSTSTTNSSTTSPLYNNYVSKTGTSMSCPGVSGTLAQLYHAYKALNSGSNPPSALMKAILLNTADDLGNPGPDYKHGWGRINARRAYNVIEAGSYLVDSVSQGGTKSHSFNVPSGVAEVRVMVYWQDVEATAGVAKALVNNLDIQVSTPSLQQVFPLVLNRTPTAAALNSNAVPGIDTLNNVEQVILTGPSAGTYSVDVAGFAVPQGPQKYYVVFEYVYNEVVLTYPIGGESLSPGVQETIRWDAYGNTGTFTLQYSTNNGGSWTNITTNVAATQRYYNWTPPTTVTAKALIKVIRGPLSDQSDAPFTVIGVPSGLTVNWVCLDSMMVSYNAVTGASKYIVTVLGAQYMDSVASSTTTSCIVRNINTLTPGWFSVQAVTADSGKGRRAIALQRPAMPFNCSIPNDNSLAGFLTPDVSTYVGCQGAPLSQPVSIQVKNNGTSSMANVTAKYTVNGGTPIVESIPGPITSQATITHTFTQPIVFSTPGLYTIKAWVEHPLDLTNSNDTLTWQKNIVHPPLVGLPFSEDFESFTICDTSANCGLDVCALSSGWLNQENGVEDSIDWRINSGPTPDAFTSSATGPVMDYNPGTATGKYAYLEATGCYGKNAGMISPCIDLTDYATADLTYAYHMFGASMGSLHVDVFANGAWTNSIATPISGDQGNAWTVASVPLTAYAGQIINIRFRGVTGGAETSDMAVDDVKISGTLGVDDPSGEVAVKVYPNPSEGIFTLSMSGVKSILDVTLTDISGKVVEQRIIAPSSTTVSARFDLGKAASGIYLLTIRSNAGVINRKLTKL